MWPGVSAALIGFAWAQFQWITSVQAQLFTVLTGSVSYHRVLAAASRQIFSSGSLQTCISLVVATWTLSTLVLGAVSLGWVLGMVLYRCGRWLTSVWRQRLNPTPTTASEAVIVAPQTTAEPLPSFLDLNSIAAAPEALTLSKSRNDVINDTFLQDDTLVPFANLPVDARHAALPDYDSVDSISSVSSISAKTCSGAIQQEGGCDAFTMEEDLFGTGFSGGAMTNETRAKANFLISRITAIKRRLIERVTLEIASTHADFSVGPSTRNEISKDLRNKLCRTEMHLSRVIGFIIQQAMGYSEYSGNHANSESFLSMSADEIENYCASIITGSVALEVPLAPPSTRATTPTSENGPRSFTAVDSSVLCSLPDPSKAELSASDSSSPCRNTLIFSASEEENLQDLLADLKHLPPGSPSSISKKPTSKDTNSGDPDKSFASWYRTISKSSSATRPSTGTEAKGKFYEPLSPISPFIGGKDDANRSFSTSTPRGPKSFNAVDGAPDTSMILDSDALMDTTLIMDTSMILGDSSLDTIRLDSNASAGVSTGTGVSTISASTTRRWSVRIKDKGRAMMQEPNTPPHTPLAVVNGLLRARAAHAERRQAKRREQANAVAGITASTGAVEHEAHARRRGHARSRSSSAGQV